jgi:hypothetical protein
MNLSVKNEDACTVLQSVRELLRDNVLPRLTNLEEQVRLLRRVTWPVCQSAKEQSQLCDIESKRQFLSVLDPDEANELLRLKSKGHLTEEVALLKQTGRR